MYTKPVVDTPTSQVRHTKQVGPNQKPNSKILGIQGQEAETTETAKPKRH